MAPTWKFGETLPIEIWQQTFRLMTTGNPDAAPTLQQASDEPRDGAVRRYLGCS